MINKTEQQNEKLILLAKKLSLVELQIKLTQEIETINTRIQCLETEDYIVCSDRFAVMPDGFLA